MKKLIIMTVSVLIFLVLLGSFCYNKMRTGVWAIPFIRGREVAVFKTTSEGDATEKYYTIFANGSVAETAPRDSVPNLLYYSFDSQQNLAFTSVDIEHIIPVEYDEDTGRSSGYVYVDAQGNEYNEFPRVDDDELVAVQGDLFEQLSRERQGSKQFFRDRDTIFVGRLNDCGFGVSNYKVYAYDINACELRLITTIPTTETIDWIYVK